MFFFGALTIILSSSLFRRQAQALVPIFSITILALLFLYEYFALRPVLDRPTLPTTRLKTSLVICFRNELPRLKKNLTHWLNQRALAQMNFVFIDDASQDQGSTWLTNQLLGLENCEVYRLIGQLGKKAALREVLSTLDSDYILLTDADCTPASDEWAELMLGLLGESPPSQQYKTDIVLGYSPVRKTKGLVNFLSRYENFLIAIRYCSFADRGLAYMGVGRNMAYTREIFQDHYPLDNLLSGEDDLLVSSAAKENMSITVCLDPKSWCWTDSSSSFSDWFRRKRRHVRTSFSYGFRQKTELTLYPILQSSFYLLLIGTFLIHGFWIGFGLLFLRYMLSCWHLIRWKKILPEKDLIYMHWLLEPFLLLCYLYIGIAMLIAPFKSWK